MRRLSIVLGLVALVSVVAPATSYAQQSLNFYIGGFVPTGADGRDRDDVLRNNLSFLAFNLDDFHGFTAGGEYVVGLGAWLDAGLGVGIYQQTVPSVYADLVNDNGSEIDQEMKLRIVPFTATIRFLPLGRTSAVQPYIGAGVGVLNYHYSESGEFVDVTDGTIFRDTFVGDGTATGPIVVGGVRFPLGQFAVGGEFRKQWGTDDLPIDQGFSGSKIDLGGWTYAATFAVRF